MHHPMISVIIPAYNEEKTIGDTITQTKTTMNKLQLPYEIIVVNDGSTDQTKQIAQKHNTTILSNKKNQGKGTALRKGFQKAQGNIIITIDSDGSHQPKEIPHLIHPLLNGTDIVTGSRFLHNTTNPTTKLNRLGNTIFNIAIMTLTGKHITDSQTGFRAIKKQVLQEITLQSQGYEIETELTIKGLKNGFTHQEKQIQCNKRKHNTSNLRPLQDGIRILKTILQANFTNNTKTTTTPTTSRKMFYNPIPLKYIKPKTHSNIRSKTQ